ncbi:MAG: hypothetical protein EOO89_24935, partial [Pedobacter sp.]
MKLSLFILFSLLFSAAFSQDGADPVGKKMQQYAQANKSDLLFVHFDKNIYTNYETIWFTGYLLGRSDVDLQRHKVLSVALIRDADSTVISSHKFIMENGISMGNIILPDSIPPGDHHLVAYTDLVTNKRPLALFKQPVTIKLIADPDFKANIQLLESGSSGSKDQQVMVSVISKTNSFLPKPATIKYRYGNINHTVKTDAMGRIIINLPNGIISDPKVYAKVLYGKDSSFLNLEIPARKSRVKVKFYPESGHLIHQI